MSLQEHSKTINEVAKKLFKQHGIVRKGQSRMWLDDNGWFTTIVEFQPHSYNRGTFLNVGVNFHWYPKEYWSFDIGHRENEFVEFKDELQFTHEIEKLTQLAINKALNYREQLSNISAASLTILQHKFTSEILWGSYHKAIISGLIGDKSSSKKYFEQVLNHEDYAPWVKDLKTQTKSLNGLLNNDLLFKTEVENIISKTRELKKLKKIEFSFYK